MADFTTRFNELLTRTSENDTAIAMALGVSKQTISAWKNGSRFPKRPAIRTIADYFHVGVPWLEGLTDDESAGIESPFDSIRAAFGPDAPLSKQLRGIGEALGASTTDPGEAELVDLYRALNDKGRADMLRYARYLNADPEMKKDGASSIVTA